MSAERAAERQSFTPSFFIYSPTTHRLRVIAVGLLVAAGCINYLDRAAVAVAEPQIHQELHLSYGQVGVLLSAFAWSYGLAQIPAGTLLDRFGARRTLGVGLVLWSLAQLGATFVRSLSQFIVARVALGLGESPMYIGGTRVCTDWFALDQRALPIAIFNSSSGLAPALAPPLLTWLMLAFGWREMFLIAGLGGFAVTALWVVFYRAPENADVPAADLAEIRRQDSADVPHIGFRQALWLLRFPTTWGMFLGFFGVVYISWLYATWLPAYLESSRHQSVASAGFWAAVPLAAGFFGALGGGFISEGLIRRGLQSGSGLPLAHRLRPAGGRILHNRGVAERKRLCRNCPDRLRAFRGERRLELRMGSAGCHCATERRCDARSHSKCRRLGGRRARAFRNRRAHPGQGIVRASLHPRRDHLARLRTDLSFRHAQQNYSLGVRVNPAYPLINRIFSLIWLARKGSKTPRPEVGRDQLGIAGKTRIDALKGPPPVVASWARGTCWEISYAIRQHCRRKKGDPRKSESSKAQA